MFYQRCGEVFSKSLPFTGTMTVSTGELFLEILPAVKPYYRYKRLWGAPLPTWRQNCVPSPSPSLPEMTLFNIFYEFLMTVKSLKFKYNFLFHRLNYLLRSISLHFQKRWKWRCEWVGVQSLWLLRNSPFLRLSILDKLFTEHHICKIVAANKARSETNLPSISVLARRGDKKWTQITIIRWSHSVIKHGKTKLFASSE